MKQLFYTIVILAGLTASACIIQSCTKPDDDPHCGEIRTSIYKIFESHRAKIPYKGDEAVIMISNQGDTITCYGEGREDFDTREYELNPNPACGNSGGINKIYEASRMKFTPENESQQIVLEQYVRIFKPDKFDEVKIIFKQTAFYIGSSQISLPEYEDFIGDVTIGTQTYHDVTKALKDGSDYGSYVLLNKTNGILMIKLGTDETWKILN